MWFLKTTVCVCVCVTPETSIVKQLVVNLLKEKKKEKKKCLNFFYARLLLRNIL